MKSTLRTPLPALINDVVSFQHRASGAARSHRSCTRGSQDPEGTAGQRAHVHSRVSCFVRFPISHSTTLSLTFSHGYLMVKLIGAATHLLNNDPICEWGMEIGSQSAKKRESEHIVASLTWGGVCRVSLAAPACLWKWINAMFRNCFCLNCSIFDWKMLIVHRVTLRLIWVTFTFEVSEGRLWRFKLFLSLLYYYLMPSSRVGLSPQ